MRRGAVLVSMVCLLLTGAVSARAGDVDLAPALTNDELAVLVGHLADAMDMPAAPARPLGITGFDLTANVFWLAGDSGSGWWQHGLGGASESLGGLVGGRLVLRKGLGFGLDAGAQVGALAGETFWTGELRKAVLDGGALQPALGVSASWSRLDAGDLSLDVVSLRVTASKGFALVTPYATAGVRRLSADARWGNPPAAHALDETKLIAGAGIQVNLLPVAVRVELRRGESTVLFAGAGLRF